MNKTVFTVIGFVLFLSGMYALVLSIVGAKFTGLLFLEKLGPSGAFFTKLAMVFIGILIIFLSRTNVDEEIGEGVGISNNEQGAKNSEVVE